MRQAAVLWTTAGLIALSTIGHASPRERRVLEKPTASKKTTAFSFVEQRDALEKLCGNTTEIPYLPQGSHSKKSAATPVENRCNGARSMGERLVVTGSYNAEHMAWMMHDIPLPFIAYYMTDETAVHYCSNDGLEAMTYLTFIAEYYDCLPEITAFVHPHRASYHSHQDLDEALKRVKWKNIPGYANLHPHGHTWANFSVRDPVSNLDGWEVSQQNMPEDVDCFTVVNGTVYDEWQVYEYRRAQWLAKAWDLFFEPEGFGPAPARIRASTAAEFFVTKKRIHAHPREFYLRARQWLQDSVREEILPSYLLAVVFEFTWHHIFGEPIFLEGPVVLPCELYPCDV